MLLNERWSYNVIFDCLDLNKSGVLSRFPLWSPIRNWQINEQLVFPLKSYDV